MLGATTARSRRKCCNKQMQAEVAARGLSDCRRMRWISLTFAWGTSKPRIVQLAKSGAVRGFSLQTISREPVGDDTCESCLAGNWRKGPLNHGGLSGREALMRGPSSARLPEAGRLMGCDLYGPLNIETIDGTRYILALILRLGSG